MALGSNSIGGLVVLAHRISITLPDETYSVLKKMANQTDSAEEDLAARSVEIYIRRNRAIFDKLENGYKEMGDVNLELAEEFLAADNESLLHYEEKLSESE